LKWRDKKMSEFYLHDPDQEFKETKKRYEWAKEFIKKNKVTHRHNFIFFASYLTDFCLEMKEYSEKYGNQKEYECFAKLYENVTDWFIYEFVEKIEERKSESSE